MWCLVSASLFNSSIIPSSQISWFLVPAMWYKTQSMSKMRQKPWNYSKILNECGQDCFVSHTHLWWKLKKAYPFCNHSDKKGMLEEEIRSKSLKRTHKLLLPLTGLQDCCSPIGRPNIGPWPAFPLPLVNHQGSKHLWNMWLWYIQPRYYVLSLTWSLTKRRICEKQVS